ncbi:MAG: 2OG-Fe(II) oxygenase [Candidatus Eremiobacterota bacterium]
MRYRNWPGLFSMSPFKIVHPALPPEQVERLRQAVVESPYLAANTLNYRFSGTRGFSVIFRREGLDRLWRQFPDFSAYVEEILHPKCNAFFLNPLVIARGSRVAPHVDRSLRSWTAPDEPPDPVRVVVLYLQVPEQLEGGRLILHGRRPLVEVVPAVNKLVLFRGYLRHEVTELGGAEEAGCGRISLVCEQYRLPLGMVERIPEYEIRTKRPFEEFLQDELSGRKPTNPDT